MVQNRAQPDGREGDLEHRAAEVVEAAEQSIAALAAEALARRDYSRAATLMSLAQRFSYSRHEVGAEAAPTSGRADDGATEVAGDGAVATAGKKRYPRFRREGDTLVKVGWSKSARKTYEHRSPRSVLLQLVKTVARVGAAGKQFTTEDLLPIRDEQGRELPTYQVYLCLAWLVAVGLVQRHGRQGYTLAQPDQLERDVHTAWHGLVTR